MKIAFWHFYTFRMLRGIENLTINLANVLSRKGADVSIISAGPTLEPLTRPDSRVRLFTYPTGPYFAHQTVVPFYLFHFLKHRYDYTVAFFSDFGEAPVWSFIERVKGFPLILYLCYPYSSTKHRYESFMRLGWHQKAKYIFADSAWIAQEAEAVFKRPVATVPVGTDTTRFCPDPEKRRKMRREHGYSEHDIVLLNVSALERRKGVRHGLEAMKRMKARYPQLRYFILGKGAEAAELKKMADHFGLSGQVTFGGETTELEAFYNMADIFLMLPEDEGNSVACHEAMSCGLPPVITRSQGFTENIPKEAALFVDPKDARQVDAALGRLAEDAFLRKQIGGAASSHIQMHATWEHTAEQFLKILERPV